MLLNARTCVDAIYCHQFNQLSLTCAVQPTSRLTNKAEKMLMRSKAQYEQLQQRYQQNELLLSEYEARLIALSQVLAKLREQLNSEVTNA